MRLGILFFFEQAVRQNFFSNKITVCSHRQHTALLHAYVQDSNVDKKDYFRRSKDTLSVVLHKLAAVPCRSQKYYMKKCLYFSLHILNFRESKNALFDLLTTPLVIEKRRNIFACVKLRAKTQNIQIGLNLLLLLNISFSSKKNIVFRF